MARATDTTTRPANREYGYQFGCDGVMTVPQAMAFLSCSRSAVYRLIKDGKIRRGKLGPAARICRRSIAQYLDTIET